MAKGASYCTLAEIQLTLIVVFQINSSHSTETGRHCVSHRNCKINLNENSALEIFVCIEMLTGNCVLAIIKMFTTFETHFL